MKTFNCQHCDAPLAYTDGSRLYFAMQFVNELGRPTLNFTEILIDTLLLTCGSCGQHRKWLRIKGAENGKELDYQLVTAPNSREQVLDSRETVI